MALKFRPMRVARRGDTAWLERQLQQPALPEDDDAPDDAPMDRPRVAPRMAPRMAPPTQRVVRLGLARHVRLLIGGVLLVFGLIQWLPAASLTVLGWLLALNMLRHWFGFVAVQLAAGSSFLALSLVVGLIYSLIEVEGMPMRWEARRLMVMSGGAIVAWLFLAGTDIATTYAGLDAIPTNAPQVARDLVADPLWRGISAVYLTFIPDRAIVTGFRMVKQALTP